MQISVDAKQLEWRAGSWLANDSVALKEINSGTDMHSDNQHKFGLPERLIAKKFLFRLIFGGSAYSYAHDPDFTHVSKSERFWQNAIDAFCDKYRGWVKYWEDSVKEAVSTGKLIGPTGREWPFSPVKNYRGENVWPENSIKNYRVQGTSADIMSIIRTKYYNKLKEQDLLQKILIVNSVHDSIVSDTTNKYVDKACHLIYDSFCEVNEDFYNRFGIVLDVPIECEISIGMDLKNMTEVKL